MRETIAEGHARGAKARKERTQTGIGVKERSYQEGTKPKGEITQVYYSNETHEGNRTSSNNNSWH